MMVNLDDLCYMWQGTPTHALSPQSALLVNSIHIQGSHHKRALLLLHGFSSSPAVYRELIPHFKHHYDAIECPALPGHGESLVAFANATAKDWAHAAENACSKLCQQYEQVDVMGLSLGGLLACQLSHSFPIHHLYLLAPALQLPQKLLSKLKYTRVLNKLGFQCIRNFAGSLQSTQHSELTYRKLPLVSVIEMLKFARSASFTPPTCPVDLFLGTHDQVIDSKAIAEKFTSVPHATIHWLSDSNHVLPLDNDLNAIVECVLERNKPKKG